MGYDYDLTVIGSGPGGYVAAIRASKLGLRVALVEKRETGGTCLNRGCVPSKVLLHAAQIYNEAKTAAEYGVFFGDIGFDYEKMAKKKDEVVNKLRKGIEYLVKKNGVQMINGSALLKDKNTIEISNDSISTITSEKIIIATGSSPAKPPIPGIDGEKILFSDDVLKMTTCPEKIVIIGGGIIGVEMATIFNSLGKEVIIIEMLNRIIPETDTEISDLFRKSLEKKGVRIFTDSKVVSLKSDKDVSCEFVFDGKQQTLTSDIVIVATGRKPYTEGIGLGNAGIEIEKGFIKINNKMETSVKGIYAVGDVTGKSFLAHMATAQGMTAAVNAGGGNKVMDHSIVPGCIYTDPEIAYAGLTEEEAKRGGRDIKIGRFPVSANAKSMIMGETEGIAKIITDKKTGEILGMHIMSPRATDMIAEMCMAMKLESTIEEVSDVIHPHPTVSEILMEAAHDIEGYCVHK